jgi:hypothetical protein
VKLLAQRHGARAFATLASLGAGALVIGNDPFFKTSSRLGAQHAKAILSIVVVDALGKAAQHFLRRWFRLRLHGDDRIIG